MAIGDNVKAIRAEKKLTQLELATKINISRSYLSDIENNRKNPSTKTLQSLSNKLGVTIAYLTTGKKMMSDLTDNERKENFKDMRHLFKKSTKDYQEQIKDDFELLLSGELSFAETLYLLNVLNFLKYSDTEGIMSLTSIMGSINQVVNAPDEAKTTEEYKTFVKNELEMIEHSLSEIYYGKKEGE